MQKNDSLIPTCNVSLLTIAFELFDKHNIIKLPSNANYEREKVINVLLHAATSTTNSLESASNDLKRKNSEAEIPSSDTIFNYINCNKIEDILSAFRNINLDTFEMMELEGKVHDIAIDFHHVPFCGDKNTPLIRGMKPKNGTSWGYEYCTLDIIGDDKLTLDVIPISALKKDFSTLIELLFKRLDTMNVKVGTVYLDKEFCNDDTISALTKLKIKFVIACKFTFRTPLKKNNLIFLFIQFIANYTYAYALIIQPSIIVAKSILFFDIFITFRLGFFERCGIQAKLIDFYEYVFTTD